MKQQKYKYKNYQKACYGLKELKDNSIDAVITDPPYGIDLEHWDKIPDKQIWQDCFRVLKPGGFLLCFSSIQFQHIFTQQILEAGFEFKDVLIWAYLNGRVPPINLDKQIDKHLGLEQATVGTYKYIQGSPNSNKKSSYTKKTDKKQSVAKESAAWTGFGLGLKTAYEPIIMVQKPLEGTLVENVLSYQVGALNIDATRIPFEKGETDVGHNPHPKGRVMANIVQAQSFGDYQKFFFVGKVRDGKKTGNFHPTKKPTELLKCFIQLVSLPGQKILDPFLGSASTTIAGLELNREVIGYEKEKEFFDLSEKRIQEFIEKNNHNK